MNKPAAQADKFILRMPDGMRDRIAELAKANGRSMNAEILAHLQSSLDGGAGLALNDTDIQKLAERIAAAMSK